MRELCIILERCGYLPICGSLSYLHPGVKRTIEMVKRIFNWPNIHAEITNYIKSCLACQRLRAAQDPGQYPQRHHPPSAPFERVYIDLWETTYAGVKRILLTMIDNGTRWAEAVVVDNKTADVIAASFLKSWICRFGVPISLICDLGSSFMSDVFLGLATRLRVRVLTSSAYHTQGNALVERFHRSLKHGIVCLGMTSAVRLEFDEVVQLCLFAYRSSIHLPT